MIKGKRLDVLVVLGMHRSGTSAVARALQVLGVDLGQDLLPPVKGDNDKGYWEDTAVVQLNEDLLASLGLSWRSLQSASVAELTGDRVGDFRNRAIALLSEKTAQVETFGMKDPRIVRLLPFWKSVFSAIDSNIGYVITVRNPLSVADSLAKREEFPAEKSHYLWLKHVVASVLDTQGSRRVFVNFDRLIERPAKEIERIAGALGAVHRPDASALQEYEASFLERGLRHSSYTLEDLRSHPAVPALAADVFGLLRDVALDRLSLDDERTHQNFCRFAHELDGVSPALALLDRFDAQIADLRATARQADIALSRALADRDWLAAQRDALLASTSWRITEPMRKFAMGLEKLRRR